MLSEKAIISRTASRSRNVAPVGEVVRQDPRARHLVFLLERDERVEVHLLVGGLAIRLDHHRELDQAGRRHDLVGVIAVGLAAAQVLDRDGHLPLVGLDDRQQAGFERGRAARPGFVVRRPGVGFRRGQSVDRRQQEGGRDGEAGEPGEGVVLQSLPGLGHGRRLSLIGTRGRIACPSIVACRGASTNAISSGDSGEGIGFHAGRQPRHSVTVRETTDRRARRAIGVGVRRRAGRSRDSPEFGQGQRQVAGCCRADDEKAAGLQMGRIKVEDGGRHRWPRGLRRPGAVSPRSELGH